MTMLATGCDRMLLMVYTPQTTSSYLVQRHDTWAQCLLVWLSLLNATQIKPLSLQMAALLANQATMARSALIKESMADLRKFRLLGRVDSYNFQTEEAEQPFLDL
jgi:hypothetical protein